MTLESIRKSPGYARVRSILMRRDECDNETAEYLLDTCIDDLIVHANNGDHEACSDCLADHLGLEPDYLDDLITPFI